MISLDIETGKLGYCKAAHLLRRASFNITQQRIDQYAEYTAEEALNKLFDFNFTQSPYPYPLSNVKEITDNKNNTINVEKHLGKRIIDIDLKDIENGKAVNLQRLGQERVRSWWLYRAAKDVSIQHKLTLWLHTLFLASTETNRYWDGYDYLELLRFHTQGSLRELAIRATRNLRILDYLDNWYNSSTNRNNNYAREFLELFTILKGEQKGEGNYTNYTEKDITEAGRVFTGFTARLASLGKMEDRFEWNSVDPVTGILQGFIKVKDHDTGYKVFTIGGKVSILKGGNDEASIQKELEDFVKIIFDCEETAKNYCRRLYRFFVSRDITKEIEDHIIEPLAKELKLQDYKIEPIVKKLLMSKHFYSEKIIGSLIKSPIDLQMYLLSLFKPEILKIEYEEVKGNESESERLKKIEQVNTINRFFYKHVYDVAESSGFPILYPLNVNGYTPYTDGPLYDKKWITSSALYIRQQQADKVVIGYGIDKQVREYALNTLNYVNKNPNIFTQPEDPGQLLEDFYALLFISRPNKHDQYLDILDKFHWPEKWKLYVQYSNKPQTGWPKDVQEKLGEMKRNLDQVVILLLKSSEFQIM